MARQVFPMTRRMTAMTDKRQMKSPIQGEGDYGAGRRFQKEERAFVKRGPVEQKAHEAEAALDGPEGPDLERARRESGERGHMPER
jgi:hypothetical protein